MEFSMRFQNVFQIEKRRWLFLVILATTVHLFCQTLMLPYGSALVSLLPGVNTPLHVKYNLPSTQSSAIPIMVGDPLLFNALDFTYRGGENLGASELTTNNVGIESNLTLMGVGLLDENPELHEAIVTGDGILLTKNIDVNRSDEILVKKSFDIDFGLENVMINLSTSDPDFKKSSVQGHELLFPINENQILFQDDDSMISTNGSGTMSKPFRKRMRCNMPPKSVTSLNQMNRLLIRHRKSSRAMRPRSSSVRDQEIVAVKRQIMTAPMKNDPELYDPLFRNASMFRRSYELMERTPRVYVYKEGEKPIFHQPVLKGLYASEGWFMKLMEGSKRFVVNDPKKAHLFYMPFSSRMLEHTLYVRNSHNRTNLRQYLKNYAEKIAAKYSFWNRTGGADHFLVACHDWAPYETRHHMEHCIKALCNADVTAGFKIGRDISLPEAYVRSARDPLRDLGGKPASERHIFAFYAGNMHGYLREILLRFWNNKDPDMKIFGPMPPGVASKVNYIQHMKSSKYCICPKGYEVNSPRVVEAIFYECVPVIISDNFVPPFFEVLDWDAFAVIVAEKDIPYLKDILLSIPQEKYLKMQLGVRKVQKHFLWHIKPIKYDLFHMTLHSIWYNRIFQFKPR